MEFISSYDKTFLHLAAFQFFNQGAKVLLALAIKDLFKREYKLEPGHLQILHSVTHAPWAGKIFFGLLSDNVPIFGSRRKSYLVICALFQVISMCVLACWTFNSLTLAVTCCLCTNLSIAFSDVIMDSLMVI